MFKLAEGSLANRAFVALLSIVVSVLGIFSILTLKQELIPRVESPMVNVIAISPGATSEQIKDRISTPVEQQAATIPEVKSTFTESSSSFAMVGIEFDYGTDMARANAKVELALSRADTNFPENTTTEIISGGTSDIPLSYVAITSDGSPFETADRIRSTVVPALEKVEGLANVELVGAPEQIIRIEVDQAKVAELGIETTAIQDALENNGLAVPVGSLTEGDSTVDVTVGKKIDSIEALREIPVVAGEVEAGAPAVVHPLKDFAKVDFAEGQNSMMGRFDGKAAVAIILYPTANANIVETTADVRAVLAELEPVVGGNTTFNTLFEQGPYITGSINSLAQEGALGLVLAVIIILVFLLSIRSTVVTAISIPLSLLAGFLGMYLGGYTLNMLTLAALTLSIGRVVDDSIVVIENIKRHLDYGKEKRVAIIDAVREVASAVTGSTIVSFIVFVPIGLVPGMVGELFRPFAFTVVIAMAASLFVALSIVPVLAYWFLKPSKAALLAEREGRAEEHRASMEKAEERYWLRRAYKPALLGTQKHPVFTLVGAVLLLIGTIAVFPLLKVNLLGNTSQGTVIATQQVAPGTSLAAQAEESDRVQAAVADVPGVQNTAVVLGNNPMMGSGITYMVAVDPDLPIDEIEADVLDAMRSVAGEENVETAMQGMLGSNTVDVQITAPNPDALNAATEAVAERLTGLPEAAQVKHDLAAEAPAVQVTVDRAAAAAMGLNENDIVGMISAQMVEPEIGSITVNNIDTAIHLSIANPVTDIAGLREMTVLGQPINTVASIDEVKSIPTISTVNGQTTATVSVTPALADNLGAVSDAVTAALEDVELPDGAVTSMGGAAEQLADSFQKLVLALVVAVLLIYVVLVWIFKSLIQPGLLLVSIPFAAIGSFLALLVTDTPLDLSAMVGLLMLTGIVVTNAVVLIDLINQYRERGESLTEAIRKGAMHRVRPIVMTALSTIAAMVPMGLGLSSSSGFISQPLAITVMGGLVSSTLLTLVLLPVLYRLVVGGQERRAAKRAARLEKELDEAARAVADTAETGAE